MQLERSISWKDLTSPRSLKKVVVCVVGKIPFEKFFPSSSTPSSQFNFERRMCGWKEKLERIFQKSIFQLTYVCLFNGTRRSWENCSNLNLSNFSMFLTALSNYTHFSLIKQIEGPSRESFYRKY